MKNSPEARRFFAFPLELFLRDLAPVLCGIGLPLLSVALSQSVPQQSFQPGAAAQPQSTQAETKEPPAEIDAHEQPATFKVNVKLVVVRVVVRDARGHAVGTLHREDFQIFDRGRPQVISQFEVEQPGDLTAKARQTSEENGSDKASTESVPAAQGPSVPERFVAYVFDDVHLQFGDLARVRQAAERHFATLRPTDRAAIFTTSGQDNLDFTDDRAKLHAALLRLTPRPISSSGSNNDCPDISYYQADLIFNQHDPQANQVAMQEALACPSVVSASATPAIAARIAAALVNEETQQALQLGDQESHFSLGVLKQVVLNISRMPGQRSVVLVSPGFIAPQMEFQYIDIIDRAVRSQVVINTLDARGLYTIDTLGDIANPPQVAPPPQKGLFLIAAANANDDLLAVLADGTGGVFFHNSNDYDDGFRRTAQAPEYWYVLAFTPQDLKLDGNFHPLKVTVKNSQKLTVQARRGYFAPKHLADPNEQAKQEIEDALYSQEELHNLPVKLHTQYFKASDDAAKLVVLAHVDVQRMHYRKADGRNNDVLTCVSAVFNGNGNFLQGLEKTVTMHWKDDTLEHKLASGITLKSSFDVKPGSYLVRLVVRDSEGQLMSAENGTVEIR
jgi:VWFA-related protein